MLRLAVRVAPENGALQVPKVAPRASWPTGTRTQRAATSAWRDVALASHGREPSLLALGELLHWLQVSPTGCAEAREASAYWKLCRRQERDLARELSALRRAASGDGGDCRALREDDATAPDLASASRELGPAAAVELLQNRGLLSAAAAKRLQALPLAFGAPAAERSLWGVRLTTEALRASRAQGPGLVRQETPAPVQQPEPAQLYAECLAAMLDAGRDHRAQLLPEPAGQYLVTAELRLPACGVPSLPTQKGQGDCTGFVRQKKPTLREPALLSLSTVDLAGGTPRVLALA